MVKSSIFFLSVLLLLFSSCEKRVWYKKELTPEVKKQYADQLWRGGYLYNYQGSVGDQLQLIESKKLDPENADMWREKAIAYLKRGIPDNFHTYYQEAVKRKPEKWAGFRGYVYLYFYRDFHRAIADFNLGDQTAGEVQYSQGQNHDYMRGVCYYGLEDYTTALDQLSKYIDQISEEEGEEWVDVYAILYKGLSLMKLGRLDQAVASFDTVLKYYPNLSDCYYHKAKIYVLRGQYNLALLELTAAEKYFKDGYFHQRPYVEVLDQIYLQDIRSLRAEISTI